MLAILEMTQVIVGILLIAVILIQNKNVSLNLASMGGGMGPVSKRGPEKILFQATIILGTLFIINSVAHFLLA